MADDTTRVAWALVSMPPELTVAIRDLLRSTYVVARSNDSPTLNRALIFQADIAVPVSPFPHMASSRFGKIC